METLLYSIAIVAGLGLVLGLALALADKYISVPPDEKEAKILANLSGANCGSCGYAGCAAMAKALAKGEVTMSKCPVASNESRQAIADLLGSVTTKVEPKAAFISCRGGKRCIDRAEYHGLADCKAAAASGTKGCAYGCIGMLSCARVCPVNAIAANEHGVAVVDRDKCIACGKCVLECPHKLITILPLRTKVYLGCNSKDRGKKVKEVCSVGCIGCGLCAKVCQENAIIMQAGRPVIQNDLCVGCGKCKERCPQLALY